MKCDFCGQEIVSMEGVTKIQYGQDEHLVHKACLEQKLKEAEQPQAQEE